MNDRCWWKRTGEKWGKLVMFFQTWCYFQISFCWNFSWQLWLCLTIHVCDSTLLLCPSHAGTTICCPSKFCPASRDSSHTKRQLPESCWGLHSQVAANQVANGWCGHAVIWAEHWSSHKETLWNLPQLSIWSPLRPWRVTAEIFSVWFSVWIICHFFVQKVKHWS